METLKTFFKDFFYQFFLSILASWRKKNSMEICIEMLKYKLVKVCFVVWEANNKVEKTYDEIVKLNPVHVVPLVNFLQLFIWLPKSHEQVSFDRKMQLCFGFVCLFICFFVFVFLGIFKENSLNIKNSKNTHNFS